MRQVNIHEAKTQLSKLIEAVERGEDVTIARNGRPVAVLSAVPGDRRSGFGSVPEFAAWTPELLEELDAEILQDIDVSSSEAWPT
ncbi:MAG: type II toxin-antitoxin system prevent-host-death family antitoxin [Patulibacter sp.]